MGWLHRFGIYKRVRQHAARLESAPRSPTRRITPHVFRHTAAVHLLEAGVEVNVIRGWLGHVSLETTNRYAEITVRMKEAAMKLCEPPIVSHRPLARRVLCEVLMHLEASQRSHESDAVSIRPA